MVYEVMGKHSDKSNTGRLQNNWQEVWDKDL